MARARNIKPAFFKNELLVEMGPFDRLLFIGLWCLADREGRVEDRPKRIKMELFPCDLYDVDAGLRELEGHGFIKRYEASGVKVVAIANFHKHQTPHGTERDSELPDEAGDLTVHERDKRGYATGKKRKNNVKKAGDNMHPPLPNVNPPCDNALNPDSLNPDSLNPEKESKLSCSAPQAAPSRPAQKAPKKPADKPAEPASGILIPLNDGTDFDVPLANIEEWRAAYPAVDVEQQLREMRVWCLNNPVNRKTRRGIGAFATRWLGREQDKAPRGGGYESYGRSSIFAGAI